MKFNYPILLSLAASATMLAMPGQAAAQNITARSTMMNWSAIYGGGPTVFEPSDSFNSSAMESSFSQNLNFTDVQSGDFPIAWAAAVDIDINQEFSIVGPLNNFTSISADMDGQKSQGAGGIGAAGIQSVLPGNELIFSFTVASTMNYSLVGNFHYDLNFPFVSSAVSIQTFNGFFWSDMPGVTTSGLGNSGPFNFNGTLAAGDYRLLSYSTLQSGPTTQSSSNNYTLTNLDAVPEPGTMLALSAACLFLRRKKRA